jgi:hypothetical protein
MSNATGDNGTMPPLVVQFTSFALVVGSMACNAQGVATPSQAIHHNQLTQFEELSRWLKSRFSETELARLQPDDLKLESHNCNCYDEPNKHFPYSIVLLRTPKGDLVTRPERREGSPPGFTALAVRYENRYCEVDAEQSCYGSFADICEFTDARYGAHLAPFFPTCKSDEP